MYQNLQAQQPNSKYKTQLCRHFITIGSCALGTRCQFAHGRQELRTNNQVMTNYIQPNMQQNNQVGTQNRVQNINPMIANYKTQLCKHFNPQTGQCKNGSTCTFAHGEQELNQINPYLQNQYMLMQKQIKQQNQATLQAELTQQILIMILTNMEAIFPGQNNILNLLRLGQEKAKQGDNQTASEIIKQIIHDESRTKEEKSQYQLIYNNAQNHYNQKLKECNM
ncbi:unnamed protein product [Paramecium pentaurelia]|uniref:C3H1-type domain-containing protein n=1 Tax=Paramecium pentaurelia TaxID=43138 RepID=A0A8S1SN47_9CILI|nr:unnamed protein product [Paramecium pentaurelia]